MSRGGGWRWDVGDGPKAIELANRYTSGYASGMKTAASLSDRVRDAIRRDGRSISELSRLAGLQQPTLSRFANGHRDLTGDLLGRLLPVLGLHISQRKRG
jgi:predicted XRE-type DNA-binding protein